MNTSLRILLWLNDRFSMPSTPPRGDPDSYSEWEFQVAKDLYEEWYRSLVSFDRKFILDVGIGLGGNTVYYSLQSQQGQVHGIDINAWHVRQAKRFAEKKGKSENILFELADAASLPFADGTYDIVISNQCMEHFPNPWKSLGEMRRVLKEGGMALLEFPPYYSAKGAHLYDHIKMPWCQVFFSDATLVAGVRAIGRARAQCMPPSQKEAYLKYTETQVDQFLRWVNKMSLCRFRRVLYRSRGWRMIVFQKRPSSTKTRPLIYLPFLEEFFVTSIRLVLQKRSTEHITCFDFVREDIRWGIMSLRNFANRVLGRLRAV